jgi:hypothetical protein
VDEPIPFGWPMSCHVKIGETLGDRINPMRKSITSTIFSLAILQAGAATSGPLSNLLVDSIGDAGTIEWAEGYQEGRKETLEDVIIRLNEGRRVDIESVEMDYAGSSLIFNASDVRLNPTDEILLLKADKILFKGGTNHLSALWNPQGITSACGMVGPKASLSIENFGLMLAPPDGTIDDDSRIMISRLGVSQKSTGDAENCRVELGFSVEDYDARMGDGSSTVAEMMAVTAEGPGSLSSLAADPGQSVSFAFNAQNATSLLYGGATAWAVEKAVGGADFDAIGLVPALTHVLKYRSNEFDDAYWMRLWNSLIKARGGFEFDIDSLGLRTANVLPPESVTKVTDAGLSTIFLSTSGSAEFSGSKVNAQAELDAVGLMSSRLEAQIRLSSYPDQAIADQSLTPSLRNVMLPIHIDKLRYDQADDGIIDAATDIMGVPVTVRISQIREEQSALNTNASAVIRQVATDFATFATISYQKPPARLVLSVIDELDLREALIVSTKAPNEIPNIFDYQVGTGAP